MLRELIGMNVPFGINFAEGDPGTVSPVHRQKIPDPARQRFISLRLRREVKVHSVAVIIHRQDLLF